MKNSLGNPARGEAFYPRESEVQKIYRVLAKGTSIYLSAPRRVGKTSILKHIEEFPQEGYFFVYVITDGYFGLTMPVISVKPCHSERSFKEGYFLFIFQDSLSQRFSLEVYSMGRVYQSVQDSICDGSFPNDIIPSGYGQLGGYYG